MFRLVLNTNLSSALTDCVFRIPNFVLLQDILCQIYSIANNFLSYSILIFQYRVVMEHAGVHLTNVYQYTVVV